MKPVSDFTTPRRLIAPISRHFFPDEQPDPDCCATGLKNGSRLPFIAHFLSSRLVGLGASATFTAAAGATAGAGFVGARILACFASVLAAGAVFAADAFTSATFGAGRGFRAAGVAAVGPAVFAPGAAAFEAGAGALLATAEPPSWVCRIRTTLPAGPGAISYAKAFSRSTTTLVVGGVLPSIPMRTPLTPALPTGILFCEVATTVSGSSTTRRAGELRLITLGVTVWLEPISI